jgi:hypothetical protein
MATYLSVCLASQELALRHRVDLSKIIGQSHWQLPPLCLLREAWTRTASLRTRPGRGKPGLPGFLPTTPPNCALPA